MLLLVLSYNLPHPTSSFTLPCKIGRTIIRLLGTNANANANAAVCVNRNVVNHHDGVMNCGHTNVIRNKLYSTLHQGDICRLRTSRSIHGSVWGSSIPKGSLKSFTSSSSSSLSSSLSSNGSKISTSSNNNDKNHTDKYYYEYGNDEYQQTYPILSIETIKEQIGQNRTIASKPFTWKNLQYILEEQNDPSLLSRSIKTQSRYMHYTTQMKYQWVDINDCVVYSKFGCIKHDNHDGNNEKHTLQQQPTQKTLFTKIKCHSSSSQYSYKTQWKLSPTLQEMKERNIIVKTLVRNDFPYFVESNIQHWCLWKLNDYVTEEDMQLAIEELKTTHTTALIDVFLDEYESDDGKKEHNGEDGIGTNEGDNEKATRSFGNTNKRPFQLGKVLDTISWINPKHLQSLPDIDHAHILCLREQHYV